MFNNIFLAQKWWSEYIFAKLRQTWFKKADQTNLSALLEMQKNEKAVSSSANSVVFNMTYPNYKSFIKMF